MPPHHKPSDDHEQPDERDHKQRAMRELQDERSLAQKHAPYANPNTADAHPHGPGGYPDEAPVSMQQSIVAWYSDHGRDLPWRDPDCSAWSVLVSEVMLQQTPVVRVLPRWHDWMRQWPTPHDLADAPVADVLRAWDRLGYPRRALRLRECAQAICDRHDGQVPANEAELLALPGIGEYTAAAVVAFAYGRSSVVLDTNVRRVIARAFDGRAIAPPQLTNPERRRAGALVPAGDEAAAQWAAASMELGALVCTAKNPNCDACPVRADCAWVAAGQPPAPAAHQRRPQAWHGTDRQMRGQIMAILRDQTDIARDELQDRVPGAGQQFDRCLASLIVDGLAIEVVAGDAEPRYRLPA